jgi:hypothetical protein
MPYISEGKIRTNVELPSEAEKIHRLPPPAKSLNPPADHLYGKPGHRGFLQALDLICAQAVAQTCQTHPLHESVLARAEASRTMISDVTKEGGCLEWWLEEEAKQPVLEDL